MGQVVDWKGVIRRFWFFIRIPLGILFVLFATLVAYRMSALDDKERTAAVVAEIKGQMLTLDDVMGKNLPPQPDPKLVDATIEGVDVNENGIRDDVELAIFKKYPNDAKIRAAELQYAMGLQVILTSVFNTETWSVATQRKGRGFGCVYDIAPEGQYKSLISEVEALVFNTSSREDTKNRSDNYQGSFSTSPGPDCDVNQ